MTECASIRKWTLLAAACFVPVALVGITLHRPEYNELFFVHSAYYVLLAMLVIYAKVRLTELGSLHAWTKENRAGILITTIVSIVVLAAVSPGFRVLADEANLVGVSKNLFFHKTANLAATGKWYFDNYWNIDEVTDRRPALFPFLTSLLHVIRGYHAENAFHLNAILFVLFVFSSYRLAKRLGGDLFGMTAAIAVAISPNTLVAARSAGFDLLATLLLLVVVASLRDYIDQPSSRQLAALSLTLCLLAHVRYEGWALLGGAATALFALRIVKSEHLRGHGLVYMLMPVFLLPRYWQTVAKAHDAEQPLSASLFRPSSFWHNGVEFLRVMARPWAVNGPHSPLLLILGVCGILLVAIQLGSRLRAGQLAARDVRFAAVVAVLLGIEFVVCFAYIWGNPLHPASARLFLWLDTFASFAAAWFLTWLGRRVAASVESYETWGLALPPVGCAILFVMSVPVASEARFMNALILTRQAAETWRFFERLGEKRILILSDRPGLFTIMDYGALEISTAGGNRNPLYELSRHLYKDIYLIQEVELATGRPLPAFDPWPDVETEPVGEFQNTESESVRISRVRVLPISIPAAK